MTTIAGGRLTLGKTYLFKNKADSSRALNVWCSSTYPADNLSNVCLWTADENDDAQRWELKAQGSNYVLKSVEGCKGITHPSEFKYLDLYTGSGDGANRNAQLYTVGATCHLAFEEGEYNNTVRIKLAGQTNNGHYLTANQGSNGTRTGKKTGSPGNVYFWGTLLTDDSQEWIPVDLDEDENEGGSTEPGNNGDSSSTWQRLIMPINKSNITVAYKENSPAYHEQGFEDPTHYAVDMTGNPKSFYASGDGEVVDYSNTNRGPLGKWLAVRYNNVIGVNGTRYSGLIFRYCHLEDVYKTSGFVHVDDETPMARMGNTGTRDVHLHVEVDTDVDHPNKTPTIKAYSNGLIPANNDDTTIDPFLVFHKKITWPEEQTVTGVQTYCDKVDCETCETYTQYPSGQVPYINMEQCDNVPSIE